MREKIEGPRKDAAEENQQEYGDLIAGFNLIEFAFGQCVFNGFAVGGFIDGALECVWNCAGVSADVAQVQTFEPNLRGPFKDDEGGGCQAQGIEESHYTSKLKVDLVETIFNLGEDSIFVGRVLRVESDAETQVRTGLIPRHGGDQFF